MDHSPIQFLIPNGCNYSRKFCHGLFYYMYMTKENCCIVNHRAANTNFTTKQGDENI